MQQIRKLIYAFFLAPLLLAPTAQAAFVNPDPTTYSNDTNTELFSPIPGPNQVFVAIEFLDFASLVTTSTFGFYFANSDPSDPANRIGLFGPAIHNTVPAQQSLIDLSNGFVFDVNNSIITSTFASLGNVIGFYLDLPDTGLTLYSQTSLNVGNLDFFAFFPFLSDPNTLLVQIQVPDGNGGDSVLAFELLANLRSVTIPEPGTFSLLLIALFFSRHFRNKLS